MAKRKSLKDYVTLLLVIVLQNTKQLILVVSSTAVSLSFLYSSLELDDLLLSRITMNHLHLDVHFMTFFIFHHCELTILDCLLQIMTLKDDPVVSGKCNWHVCGLH